MPVYMTVYEGAAEVALGDPIQFTSATPGGADSAAITASGANSPNVRRRVRLYSTTAVWVAWGANPTATDETDSMALGADNPEYIDMQAGHVLTATTRA